MKLGGKTKNSETGRVIGHRAGDGEANCSCRLPGYMGEQSLSQSFQKTPDKRTRNPWIGAPTNDLEFGPAAVLPK